MFFNQLRDEIISDEELNMEDVRNWLKRLSSTYLRAKKDFKILRQMHGTPPGVPVICNPTTSNPLLRRYLEFFSLYEELNTLGKYHKFESHFKKEMAYYQTIKNSEEDLKKWTRKHIHRGTQLFSLFAIDYVDYIGNEVFGEEKCPLKPCLTFLPDFDIYINRQDFQYTLQFVDVFQELFHVRKILPDIHAKREAEVDELIKNDPSFIQPNW